MAPKVRFPFAHTRHFISARLNQVTMSEFTWQDETVLMTSLQSLLVLRVHIHVHDVHVYVHFYVVSVVLSGVFVNVSVMSLCAKVNAIAR